MGVRRVRPPATLTGGGLGAPIAVGIDGSGNVIVVNTNN